MEGEEKWSDGNEEGRWSQNVSGEWHEAIASEMTGFGVAKGWMSMTITLRAHARIN